MRAAGRGAAGPFPPRFLVHYRPLAGGGAAAAGGAPPPLPPAPPASSLFSSSSLQFPLAGRVSASGLLEPFRNGNLRGGGVRAPGGRGAGTAGLRAGLPIVLPISQAGGGGGGQGVGCQPPPPSARAPGARAGWGGACFREPRFLLKPVDSTPLSSLSRRLLGFLEEVLGRRLGSERRECAEGRASPRHPLPATPRPSVRELREGGADFPGAAHPSGLACSARGQLDLTLWTST